MAYRKYFSKSQKVFIRRIFTDEDRASLDTITGYAMNSPPMQLDLGLPYGCDAADCYPFEPGMRFSVMTDSMGMGLRLEASFVEKLSSRDIRLQFEGNLEFISRRIYPRVDVNAFVGVNRGKGNLSEKRQLWNEHLVKIGSGVPATDFTDFKKYLINLAGGGLRITLEAPVELAELVLVYLSIGDKKGIICALTEVLWVGKAQANGTQSAGLRFLNILEEDQNRINRVVQLLLDRLGKSGEEDGDE